MPLNKETKPNLINQVCVFILRKEFPCIDKKKIEIDFNGISIHLGLFYALRLGN